MTELVPLSSPPSGHYSVPASVPHYGGSRFIVPNDKIKAGLIIYASGLTEAEAQPMVLAVCPDFLFLGNEKRTVWWRAYDEIRSVRVTEVTLVVPTPTPSGGTVGKIMRDAKAVEISFAAAIGGGEISLVLVTLHPYQASSWRAQIDRARIDYENRLKSAYD